MTPNIKFHTHEKIWLLGLTRAISFLLFYKPTSESAQQSRGYDISLSTSSYLVDLYCHGFAPVFSQVLVCIGIRLLTQARKFLFDL